MSCLTHVSGFVTSAPAFPALEAGRGRSGCNEEVNGGSSTHLYTLFVFLEGGRLDVDREILTEVQWVVSVSSLTHKLSAEHGAMPSV
jgi:hypothetical protein